MTRGYGEPPDGLDSDEARERAEWLLEVAGGLTAWESDFCESITETAGELTPRQIQKVDEIYERREPEWHTAQRERDR